MENNEHDNSLFNVDGLGFDSTIDTLFGNSETDKPGMAKPQSETTKELDADEHENVEQSDLSFIANMTDSSDDVGLSTPSLNNTESDEKLANDVDMDEALMMNVASEQTCKVVDNESVSKKSPEHSKDSKNANDSFLKELGLDVSLSDQSDKTESKGLNDSRSADFNNETQKGNIICSTEPVTADKEQDEKVKQSRDPRLVRSGNSNDPNCASSSFKIEKDGKNGSYEMKDDKGKETNTSRTSGHSGTDKPVSPTQDTNEADNTDKKVSAEEDKNKDKKKSSEHRHKSSSRDSKSREKSSKSSDKKSHSSLSEKKTEEITNNDGQKIAESEKKKDVIKTSLEEKDKKRSHKSSHKHKSSSKERSSSKSSKDSSKTKDESAKVIQNESTKVPSETNVINPAVEQTKITMVTEQQNAVEQEISSITVVEIAPKKQVKSILKKSDSLQAEQCIHVVPQEPVNTQEHKVDTKPKLSISDYKNRKRKQMEFEDVPPKPHKQQKTSQEIVSKAMASLSNKDDVLDSALDTDIDIDLNLIPSTLIESPMTMGKLGETKNVQGYLNELNEAEMDISDSEGVSVIDRDSTELNKQKNTPEVTGAKGIEENEQKQNKVNVAVVKKESSLETGESNKVLPNSEEPMQSKENSVEKEEVMVISSELGVVDNDDDDDDDDDDEIDIEDAELHAWIEHGVEPKSEKVKRKVRKLTENDGRLLKEGEYISAEKYVLQGKCDFCHDLTFDFCHDLTMIFKIN